MRLCWIALLCLTIRQEQWQHNFGRPCTQRINRYPNFMSRKFFDNVAPGTGFDMVQLIHRYLRVEALPANIQRHVAAFLCYPYRITRKS